MHKTHLGKKQILTFRGSVVFWGVEGFVWAAVWTGNSILHAQCFTSPVLQQCEFWTEASDLASTIWQHGIEHEEILLIRYEPDIVSTKNAISMKRNLFVNPPLLKPC